MPGTIARPPSRKSGRTPASSRGRAIPRFARATVIERREICLGEIARLRNGRTISQSLAEKALRLLTQHWSASSWPLRSDIVRTAEWLVGVGRRNDRQPGTM
jgi:hypothetical protein